MKVPAATKHYWKAIRFSRSKRCAVEAEFTGAEVTSKGGAQVRLDVLRPARGFVPLAMEGAAERGRLRDHQRSGRRLEA